MQLGISGPHTCFASCCSVVTRGMHLASSAKAEVVIYLAMSLRAPVDMFSLYERRGEIKRVLYR